MSDCIKVEQIPGCWTKSDGSTQTVLIVREFGTSSTGAAVLVRTHFTDVNGDHVTAAAGEFIRIGACLACCGDVVISDLNPPGHKIATITLANGQEVDLNETVTNFTSDYTAANGIKIGEYANEDGTITEVFVPKQSVDVNLTPISYVPTATGNTANLGQVVVDPTGKIWIIDEQGDAQGLTMPAFKEQNRFYADPNGSDATGTGANESPYATAQAAVNALGQADTAVLNEGTYGAVTMATQNTTISGASNGYSGLVQIASLTATATGTSVRAEGLTVTGNVSHTGTAPLYLNNVTVNGNYASSSAAYTEIKDSRIQDGTISKTAAGTLYIRDSQIGNATFSTAGSIIALDNVTIDAGDTVTIGAGVIYSLGKGVTGHIVIDPAAIPAEQAALAGGLTGLAAKSVETATFNDVRLTNVPTITGATKALVRDTNGVVSEQVLTAQADINWTYVTTNPTATGNTGTLPRFTNNTVTGDKFFVDTNGVAVLVEKGTIITSFVPQHQNVAGTWADAQANSLATVADAVLLSNGDRVKYGKYTFTGHGYAIGANLYLSKTLAGVVVTTNPVDGDVHQKIAFVHDANTIEILVQEAFTQGSTASTVGANGSSASGLVARGVDVQLDNFKVRVVLGPSANQNILRISTVTGTTTLTAVTNNVTTGGISYAGNSASLVVGTTPVDLQAGWSFVQGGTQFSYFYDPTSGKAYRVTAIYATSTGAAHITIERI